MFEENNNGYNEEQNNEYNYNGEQSNQNNEYNYNGDRIMVTIIIRILIVREIIKTILKRKTEYRWQSPLQLSLC